MRYLQTFNRRLRRLRESRQLSRRDIAEMCGVDEARIAGWESPDQRQRHFPSVPELMDLCLRTDSRLDQLLDMEDGTDQCQLELPGLAFSNADDLTEALEELEREVSKQYLSENELKLLRRFRKASEDNRRMILQLLGR